MFRNCSCESVAVCVKQLPAKLISVKTQMQLLKMATVHNLFQIGQPTNKRFLNTKIKLFSPAGTQTYCSHFYKITNSPYNLTE